MIGKTATFIAILALLAVLAVGARSAVAGERETCVELRLKDNTVLKLPCLENLDEILNLLLPDTLTDSDKKPVIDPRWPHDQAMSPEHDWPYDGAMIVPPADEAEDVPQRLLGGPFDDLLGWLERDLNGLAGLLEQDSSDPWETQLPSGWYFDEVEKRSSPVNPHPLAP